MSAGPAVPLQGTGRVELPAYGLADAEHRVEKELRALWPGCTVEVLEVARPPGSRIVAEFGVAYRVRGPVAVGGAADPLAEALRTLRARLAGTRFERMRLGPQASG